MNFANVGRPDALSRRRRKIIFSVGWSSALRVPISIWSFSNESCATDPLLLSRQRLVLSALPLPPYFPFEIIENPSLFSFAGVLPESRFALCRWMVRYTLLFSFSVNIFAFWKKKIVFFSIFFCDWNYLQPVFWYGKRWFLCENK